MSAKKRFYIIDAMALAYKAYFAFMRRPLSTSKGEPTSAVYGFLSQLIRIIETHKPEYLAVAFDSKEKTFRHDRYEGYKSSRQAMPEDMIPQIQRIKEVIDAFKIPTFILPGYEADDLIGTAVKKAEALGFEAFAITPDKDFVQLISEKIKIIRPGKSTDEIITLDEEKVKEEYGFSPKQMIDYLAIVGDKSDDIPGVKGIGEKGATPLIQEFGSLENIYENIDKISKEAIKKKLIESKDEAFLSKELATIHLEAPFDCDIESTKFQLDDISEIKRILTELEFRNFISKIEKIIENSSDSENKSETGLSESKIEIAKDDNEKFEIENLNSENEIFSFDESKINYKLIQDEKSAKELVEKLIQTSLFVFDTETDSLDCFTLNLAGVSFSLKPNEAYFVAINPFPQSDDLFKTELNDRIPIEKFVEIFKPVFENPEIKKICQNAKFDIAALTSLNIEVKNLHFDTMVASYVIDPDQKHGMDELAQKYLNYRPIPLSDLYNVKKNPEQIFQIDLKKLSDYSCEDADITFRLYEILKKEIEKFELSKICYDIEFPLVEVLADMEREGVNVDKNILKSLSNDLQILLDNYSQKIFEISGEPFNINSPLQMQKILFDKLNLSTGKKTKTGFSTDAKTLESLRGEHEIINLILDYRTVAKLKSTYADSLPNLINPKTGRIHTSFNQASTATGRLSSTNPNLQNIPIRTELGKEIRKAFIPRDKNHLILSADYSQIELRIMSAICKDEGLCSAFQKGEDIHRSTAAMVFRVAPEKVTADMRRKAKEVNFGVLYGIGPFGLKNRLGITQTYAKEIIDTYFELFKGVKNFMDDSIEKARKKGYAETLLGRRRYLKNINSKNKVIRQFEERVAINMPIQGTAADMIKIAMIRINEELKKRKTKTKMILQVHDELLFDAHKSEVDELKIVIKDLMENALPMDVPIIAELGTGENWLDAH